MYSKLIFFLWWCEFEREACESWWMGSLSRRSSTQQLTQHGPQVPNGVVNMTAAFLGVFLEPRYGECAVAGARRRTCHKALALAIWCAGAIRVAICSSVRALRPTRTPWPAKPPRPRTPGVPEASMLPPFILAHQCSVRFPGHVFCFCQYTL